MAYSNARSDEDRKKRGNDYQELADVLRSVKGVASSVLLSLTWSGRPRNKRELAYLTGYSDKPISQAIQYLEGRDMVEALDGHRWQLTRNHRQWMGRLKGEKYGLAGGECLCHSDNLDLAGSQEGQKDGTRHPAEYMRDQVNSTRPALGFVAERQITDLRAVQSRKGSTPVEVPAAAGREDTVLAGLLSHMGITGLAYHRLVQREDLKDEPALVLAWWWYCQTRQMVRNPAGMCILRLEKNDPPPEGYMALAVIWPQIPSEDRDEILSMLLGGWSSRQLAVYWSDVYPELKAETFEAMMELHLKTPEELEFEE